MEWKLERIARRKLKTEDDMTWETVMTRLAKKWKRSRRHSLQKANKMPDAGKNSYYRFKSNIVKRLALKFPVASSPIATRWQQMHARSQFEGAFIESPSVDLSHLKTPDKIMEVPASPTLCINRCTSEFGQTASSTDRCYTHKVTVQVNNERKCDMAKEQLQKFLAQWAFVQEKGSSDTVTGAMDICRKVSCPHKGCETRINKDESSNQTVFESQTESIKLEARLHIRGLHNDYYLNILDWSSENLVAIALDATVQIWDGEKNTVMESIDFHISSKYISSVSWIKEGRCLAIGTSDGEVQLWDVETKKRLRNMFGHKALVGAMSWNRYILSSGSRLGFIHHHDVRVAEHYVGMLRHKESVCSLHWAPNGDILASGSSDGVLNIWPNDPGVTVHYKPLKTIPHSSAVKAMSWCPWLPDTLAVGGGMKDGGLHIWDINRGQSIKTTYIKSQICSLLWLPETEELVTGQGLPRNEMTLWNYPCLTKKADVYSHRGRVLHLALSPDQRKIFSATADGVACIWNYCK